MIAKREATLQLQGGALPAFAAVSTASATSWASFWQAGAFVGLASSTADPAAFELERRVVRSLALLRALEAGAEPPAETALLLVGNWAGKHHGEMRLWHQLWGAFFRRPEVLERSDAWYADFLANATSNAAAQGYAGARWPKMIAAAANRSGAGVDVAWLGLDFAPPPPTVNGGSAEGLAPLLAWESSSGVGPLLVWQQPHSVMLAEAQRRAAAAAGGAPAALAVMQRLSTVVFATADFLASFPYFNATDARFHLGPPLFGGEECGDPLQIFDPAFELVWAGNALDVAGAWRAALGLAPVPRWAEVAAALAPPPLDPATSTPQLYANNRACACLYEAPGSPCAFPDAGCPSARIGSRSGGGSPSACRLGSHPMVAGLHGVANGAGRVDMLSANASVAAIVNLWSWGTNTSSPQVWGWDGPLVVIAQARLGWSAEACVAMLLKTFEKNNFDANGINAGMGRGTAYFPGNGGTLLAVAALAAGFDAGAPGEALAAGGVGARMAGSAPVGFPVAWRAVTEGFDVQLP